MQKLPGEVRRITLLRLFEKQGEAAAKPDGWHHADRRYMIGSEAGTGETWDEP